MTCELHRFHVPKNQTLEWHHIIPVAWQLQLPTGYVGPSPGQDTSGRGMLWDNRGVYCCPTGHRNVHFYIESIMHVIANQLGEDVPAAMTQFSAKLQRDSQFQTAGEGVQRFQDEAKAGGISLKALIGLHEWGQI